ncbi:hypothetical protein Pcinc_019838 [Petrolisthes cinctipes]|uniref:Uncharacterized protein n=1 Tax=Petrolisthes cinctipes TaxID=88211 RepID=A0AAE1KM50_PETCI|nr:hypothetical protein Pcinc_019838 [Petrolisthes cinctipes]
MTTAFNHAWNAGFPKQPAKCPAPGINSETEENFGIYCEDAGPATEQECGLELVHYTGDNLVLQVRHVPGLGGAVGGANATYNLTSVQERDRCQGPAREVALMFQHREKRIRHDIHLSLFVLSEVVDNVPSPQRISRGSAGVRACWWAWLAGVVMLLSSRLHAASVS